MKIDELENTIVQTIKRLRQAKSIKTQNDLRKYLKRLKKERNTYYKLRGNMNGLSSSERTSTLVSG